MPTPTELHQQALAGQLVLPARAAPSTTTTPAAASLAEAHGAGAMHVGAALDEALTAYARGAFSQAARTLERTDLPFTADDELPRALLRVLCYLEMHKRGELRGKKPAADYLRENALPMLARFDTPGRTKDFRDKVRDALRA
jgi:hypothetical protein